MARKTALRDRPVVGGSIAVALWLCTVALMCAELFTQPEITLGLILPVCGNAALLLAGLFACAVFLKISRPSSLDSNLKLLMLALISLISLVSERALLMMAEETGLIPTNVALFLTPLALAPMLATLLTDRRTGAIVGLWTSLALAIIADHSLVLFVTGIVATAVTVQMTVKVRTRVKAIRTGLVIGLSEISCVFGLTALNWDSALIMPVFHQAGACLFSGLVSSIVVLLILPLFEILFRVTTDITLLELSDLGSPLLQRLAMEAPGTYHHSLIVANLAQAAADEVGANSLLTRVGAYYHDVGKLTKPIFFAENQQMQGNPHDDLPPSMSTLVITAHVKEGMSLAVVNKLPVVVQQAIQEHHGTCILSCFHHKAKSQMELELREKNGGMLTGGNNQLDESAFRYPGPKPSSRETTILSLADSIEAASRSMEKLTPAHIKNLVDNIINSRISDGQLDNSPLTMDEIHKVRKSFVFTLTNMLHGRVPYPKDENRTKQQTEQKSTESEGDSEANQLPDGKGPETES